MALAALATVLGATLQSATGFGFALVLGPVLFGLRAPAEALTTLVLLSVWLNVLMLFSERRPLHVRRAQVGVLIVAAAPGLVAGALILRPLTKPTLQVAAGIGILLGAGVQARTHLTGAGDAGSGGRGDRSRWPAAAIGLIAGALTTTTAANGPPLVLWFQHLRVSPSELRDSITATTLPLNLLGATTLALLAQRQQRFEPWTLALLGACTLGGQLVGRLAFERLDRRRFATAGLVLVVLAGVASIAAGATA